MYKDEDPAEVEDTSYVISQLHHSRESLKGMIPNFRFKQLENEVLILLLFLYSHLNWLSLKQQPTDHNSQKKQEVY